MSKPSFRQVERLFHEALALPADRRGAFLDAACAGDGELRAAVEELLRHDSAERTNENSLVGPFAHAAAQLRAEAPTQPIGLHAARNSRPVPPSIPGHEILEELGRGGMGVVYKVRQSRLNRIVALKMLLPFDQNVPEMLVRFRTEVEALARLQHPNIITIYDIGEHEGRPYFTMEYVAGPNLARLLAGRPQDTMVAARLVETLARTMQIVHRHGIIHRDLKPANVLLAAEGGRLAEGQSIEREPADQRQLPTADFLRTAIPKITDFGLAKDRAAPGKLTQTGLAMGTPSYMAPEQARSSGDGVGPATDLYALGSILYEMLTGRPPFEGENAADIVAQLSSDEPISPARLRPRLPRDLVTICLKCLEKQPRRRYASALELAEDLRRFQAGEAIRARPVGLVGQTVRWCRRQPLTAGLLLLSGMLALILLITVLVYNSRLQEALARAEEKTEQQRKQLVLLNVNIGIDATQKGEHFQAVLHFVEALRLDEGTPERERDHRARIAQALRQCPILLHLHTLDGQVLRARPGADGGWVATVNQAGVLRVLRQRTCLAVGKEIQLDDNPCDAAIGPDGRSIGVVSNGGITRVWDLTSGKCRELPRQGKAAVRRLAFLAEGRVLFTQDAEAIIRLWDLSANPLTMPAPLSDGAMEGVAFSDDGRWLFTQQVGHQAHRWDVEFGKAVALPVGSKQGASSAAISSDGQRIALVEPGQSLRVWDVAGAHWLSEFTPPAQEVGQVAFSPDAKRVITFGGEKMAQVWQVQTGERKALSPPQGYGVTDARFSPDGKWVVGLSEDGAALVWDATTGRALTPPFRNAGRLVAASFCAEGKQVITIGKEGTLAVWKLPDEKSVHAGPEALELRSIAELLDLAQVLACGRINERQQLQTLAPSEWSARWERVKQER